MLEREDRGVLNCALLWFNRCATTPLCLPFLKELLEHIPVIGFKVNTAAANMTDLMQARAASRSQSAMQAAVLAVITVARATCIAVVLLLVLAVLWVSQMLKAMRTWIVAPKLQTKPSGSSFSFHPSQHAHVLTDGTHFYIGSLQARWCVDVLYAVEEEGGWRSGQVRCCVDVIYDI